MNIVLATLFGIIGGAIACVAGYFGGEGLAKAFQIPNRDLQSAYFVGVVAVLATLIGALASIVLTLRLRGASTAGILVGTPIAVGGILMLAAAALGIFWMATPHTIESAGLQPTLDVEILPPPSVSLPDVKTVRITLQTKRNRAEGWMERDKVEVVDGKPVLTGHVDLYYRGADRLLSVDLPNQENHLFQLRLPSVPTAKKYQHWSDWQTADWVFTPASNIGQRVGPDKAYKIRYQVDRVPQ